MDTYSKLAVAIITEQEKVIGPVAVSQAEQVEGLKLNWGDKSVKIEGEPKHVIDRLVEQYKALFGKISVEVCKEAVGRQVQQLSPDQMPASLR